MSLLDLVVPGAGTIVKVPAKAYKLCQEMKEGQDSCIQSHGRLTAIFKELEQMEERNELPPSESLVKYVDVVNRFLLLLMAYRDQKLLSRLVQHSGMMKKLQQINENIDMLFKLLNLASTAAMMDWKNQWELGRREQERSIATLVANSAAVLEELRDPRALLEALATLKYEMERNAARQNEEMLKASASSRVATATERV